MEQMADKEWFLQHGAISFNDITYDDAINLGMINVQGNKQRKFDCGTALEQCTDELLIIIIIAILLFQKDRGITKLY
jgi:hypothetical protein